MADLTVLHKFGQSTWLNYLRNSFIRSGELAQRVRIGIQGVTANAQVYEQAIAGSGDYDDAIRKATSEGMAARLIHQALMVDDIQRAADVLHPIFEESDHYDGFVSYEVDPALFSNPTVAVAGIRHLSHLIDRYNVMVEVPATPIGIETIRALVADGVSVNATHLFSVADYERVTNAYIEGLDAYIRSHSVWRTTPTAVASISLSPIDAAVDERLVAMGRADLVGKTAIALAKILYDRFTQLFDTEEWNKLASKGGRPLRPKWTRITPRDFQYREDYYVNNLLMPNTVLTFSPVSLSAFQRTSTPLSQTENDLDNASSHLNQVTGLGIDLDAISTALQQAYLNASDHRFQSLVNTVMHKRDELDREWRPVSYALGEIESVVGEGLQELCRQEIVCRVWSHDHTVWKPNPAEIVNRLGWLHIMEAMAEKTNQLAAFTNTVVAEGFTHALLLGMGGSSLAPELFHKTFGRPSRPPNLPFPYLDLVVVDTTDADAIRAADDGVDLSKTLVIISTKSGGTVETLSAFKYFYNRLLEEVGPDRVGDHFIGITDPGSKIVEMAERYGFRALFLNDPNIGGRYSALSYFGLVPAGLVGVDVAELLERSSIAASNASLCHCDVIDGNLAARLGAVMGMAAGQGRDKITFLSSAALASFGDWVEQLIAESMGKEGKGILPVVGEPPAPIETYGPDRLFIHLRLEGDRSHDGFATQLATAGHPVVTIHLKDLYDMGGQFFVWEMATAIAGYFLRINPFDQPNVEDAKIKARKVVAEFAEKGRLPEEPFAKLDAATLSAFLDQAGDGDYVSIQAYVQPTPETDAAIHALRQAIHLRTGLATTAGYGPRFLHSTGQLHKGDRGNGLFIQFVSDAVDDLPIPDEAGLPTSGMTFNVLKKAQALGDAQALRDAHRRIITFSLGKNVIAGISELASKI